MLKVRVKEGMPEGFFGFYNNPDGSGQRRRGGFEGKPGDEFELVDSMTGPDSKRKVAVKAVDTFSPKWMEYWNGCKWIDRIPKKKGKKSDTDLTDAETKDPAIDE